MCVMQPHAKEFDDSEMLSQLQTAKKKKEKISKAKNNL